MHQYLQRVLVDTGSFGDRHTNADQPIQVYVTNIAGSGVKKGILFEGLELSENSYTAHSYFTSFVVFKPTIIMLLDLYSVHRLQALSLKSEEGGLCLGMSFYIETSLIELQQFHETAIFEH